MKLGYVGAAIAAVLLLFGGIIFAASSEKVSAGTVAVVTRNGADKELATPGRVWLTPGIESTVVYETGKLNLEFTGRQEISKARYTDDVIAQKSKDGVDINFAAQLFFSIPEENARQLYRERGRSQDALVQHIQVATRDETRDVIEQALVDDVYLGGMEEHSKMVEEKLKVRLDAMGVVLISFDFTAVDPSDAYKAAIEQQKEQEQLAALEQEKVAVAQQQAQQKRVTAQGDADAAVIKAQGDADAAVIRAEGEAQSNEIRDASLTDAILKAMYYDALKTINWAILESPEGAQPVMPIAPPAPEPTPAK